MATAITLHPIGTVRSTRKDPDDDGWDREEAWIELDPSIPDEALVGLESFSHVEVLTCFDRVPEKRVEAFARHPRGNPAWPRIGIFAQRASARPNRIGLTVCAVARVAGNKLYVNGLDAIDGTPVLDLKPWMREFGPRGEVRQPEWVGELMRGYWG